VKKLALLAIISFFLFGCAGVQHCPSEDVVYVIIFPDGNRPAQVPKGFFDKESEGSNWMTLKDFEAMRDNPKSILERQSEESAKEADEVLGI